MTHKFFIKKKQNIEVFQEMERGIKKVKHDNLRYRIN